MRAALHALGACPEAVVLTAELVVHDAGHCGAVSLDRSEEGPNGGRNRCVHNVLLMVPQGWRCKDGAARWRARGVIHVSIVTVVLGPNYLLNSPNVTNQTHTSKQAG